jgi:hypothetical protein
MRAAALSLALGLSALGTAAAAEPDLQRCAAIAEPAARLACFDALVARPAGVPAGTPAVMPAATPAAPDADFGKPHVDDSKSRIEAHVVGTLKGWKKGTVFVLDNGQEWQSVDEDDSIYSNIPDNPAVTLGRNFFGGYWLRIEAVQRKLSVKRIK